jgi:hypothetical protein
LASFSLRQLFLNRLHGYANGVSLGSANAFYSRDFGVAPEEMCWHYSDYGKNDVFASDPGTVQVPDHNRVQSDTQSSIDCGNNSSTLIRAITYIIEDSNNSQLGSSVSIRETAPSNLTSSCNGSTVQTGNVCFLNTSDSPHSIGLFTDFISPGCPSSPSNSPCGFTYSSQQWQWCSAGGNVSIGTIGSVSAQNTLINLGGNVLGFTPGTTFPK